MTYQSKDFKWRHFQGDVILQCVRWYCKYGINYRDLEEMMSERGVIVDHTTFYRWVQRYVPELKILIKPMRGFQSMKTAYATIKGFEVMRMFNWPYNLLAL